MKLPTENYSVPDKFRCPITHQLMTDPVILTSADYRQSPCKMYEHRFERIAIIYQLHNKKPKLCPLNNMPVDGDLKLDDELKAEIDAYIIAHSAEGVQKFDPLVYLIDLFQNRIDSAILFACQYAEVYVDQLVDKFRQGMADLLLYHVGQNSNLLVKILEIAPHCACKILQAVTGAQAAAAILKLPPDKGNALELACQHAPDAFKFFLEMQSPLEAADNILLANNKGWNKLMVACRYAPSVVAFILSQLTSSQARKAVFEMEDNEHGQNGLMIACRYSPPMIVETLLAKFDEHCDLWGYDNHDRNVLQVACHSCSPATVELIAAYAVRTNSLYDECRIDLIRHVDEDGNNALMLAIKHNPASAELILNFKVPSAQVTAQIMATNHYGQNALLLASEYAPSSILEALLNKLSSVEASVAICAVSNDEKFFNSLTYTASYGDSAKLKLLLAKLSTEQVYATIFEQKSAIERSLTEAAEYVFGCGKIENIKLLLNKLKLTPEQTAVILLQSCYAFDMDVHEPLVLACLCVPKAIKPLLGMMDRYDTDVYEVNGLKFGVNALGAACIGAPEEIESIFEVLMEWVGIRAIMQKNRDGENMLMIACKFAPELVELFLSKFINLDDTQEAIMTRNKNGWNALMYACRYASTEVEPFLHKLTPEQISEVMRAKDADGNDALSIAIQYAPQVVPLLNSKRPSSPRPAFFTANPAGENDLKKRKTADSEYYTAFPDSSNEYESAEDGVVKKGTH